MNDNFNTEVQEIVKQFRTDELTAACFVSNQGISEYICDRCKRESKCKDMKNKLNKIKQKC